MEQATASSLSEWRDELAARCTALGWYVPQLAGMGGYRLNRIARLVNEAEMLTGVKHVARDDDPQIQSPAYALGFITGKPLEVLKAEAESMPADSMFDEQHVAQRREAALEAARQKMHADQMRQAEAASNLQANQDAAQRYRR